MNDISNNRKPILTIDALVDIDQLEIGIATGINEDFLVNLIGCIISEYVNQKPCKDQNNSLDYIKTKINSLMDSDSLELLIDKK